jgi:hypothetical protein
LEKLEPIDPHEWNKFLINSVYRTIFLTKEFLDIFDVEITYYVFKRNDTILLGFPVINVAKFNQNFLPFCYYQGVVFNKEILRGKSAKSTYYIVELINKSVSLLSKREKKFNFCLHNQFSDIRGFDWVNYHEKNNKRCLIKPKYTAVINLTNKSMSDIRIEAGSSRKQEERYAFERENLSKILECDPTNLIKLYVDSYKKQGLSPSKADLLIAEKLANHILLNKLGYIYGIKNKEKEFVAAALIFKDYDDVWHVPIIGVGDTKYGGTLLYFSIIEKVIEKGGTQLDFNGANSPNRSFFKHSMGAISKLYFEIEYDETKFLK